MISGYSSAATKLAEQIAQIALLDTTVLLEGESGTGKSLAAKRLQGLSERANHPFLVVINPAIKHRVYTA